MAAGLNDIIVVEVENLKDLLLQSKCLKEVKNSEGKTENAERGGNCKPQPILLFLDGRPLKGMPPESGAPELDGENGTLRYHLQRPVKTDQDTQGDVDDTKEHWADLLGLGYEDFNDIGGIFRGGEPWTRPVSVSVGLANEYPVASLVEATGREGRFNLVRVRLLRFLFWAVLIGSFIYFFIRLAREGDIIRDRKPIAWKPGNRQRKAYSLSRTQIAWWTFFVVFGFIFIWLVTGQHDLSPSVLVLLGISVVTTVGSTAIDSNRTFTAAGGGAGESDTELADLIHKKEQMERDLSDTEKKVASGEATQAEFDAKLAAYTDHLTEIKRRFPNALGWNNVRFGIDILSDANGVNIHRFQMAMWTVVLGFIFIHEVITRLSMPEFNTTLLLLMGISNGTYLLGKSSEPQAPPAAPAAGVTSPPG